MPAYVIYEKPGLSLEETIASAVLVKDKFSWPAFLLPILWMLFKKLWWVLPVYLFVLFAMSLSDLYLPLWASMLTSFFVALLIGLEAPNLVGWSLERKGYREVLTLYAENKDHCEALYIRERTRLAENGQWPSAPGESVSPSPKLTKRGGPPPSNQPVIGLFPNSENA